jgi:hypothetical protein
LSFLQVTGDNMNNKNNKRSHNKRFAIAAVLAIMAVLLVNMTTAQSAKPKGDTTRLPSTARLQVNSAAVTRGTDTIDDGSFEAGASGDSPAWTEASTAFGSPLCTAGACGTGGGTAGPRTGDVWSWFGGNNGGGENGSMTQSLTISDLGANTAAVELYLWIGSFDAAGTDSLTVTLGGDLLFTAVETEVAYQAGYTLVSLDVSSYDDGVARDLVITGTDLAGANTNLNVDDVALVISGVGGTPTPTDVVVETATATPTDVVVETATATPTEVVTGTELVANGGFELDLSPWTLKNESGDKVKCNTETKVISNSGECAFQFKGVVGESSKIQQNVALDGVVFTATDVLDLSLFVNAKKATASGKVKVVVKYSDSEDRTKLTADIATTVGYAELTDSDVLLSAAVSKIKFQIKHSSTSGKVYVDDVSLAQVAGAPALLPLP